MCQAFAKTGHEVVLLAPHDNKNYEPEVEDLYSYYGVERCFEILKLPWLPIIGRSIFYAFIAALKARRFAPELVYCRSNPGFIFATTLRLPVIFEVHAPFAKRCRVLDWVVDKLFNSKALLKIVVITHALRQNFEKKYPSSSSKIIVAPDGADPLPAGLLPVVFRNRGERLQVGYVGHLYAGKGMEIVSELAGVCLWADFHIVGGTEEDIAYWKNRCNTLSNIIFHGYVASECVPAFILACDVVLLPNQKNVSVYGGGGNIGEWTSPLKAFEYMSAAKPILCSDLPVLREIFEHDRNALLCPPDDLATWAITLARLRFDEVARIRLGQAAHKDFIEKYTWSMRSEAIIKEP